jgi:predicted AlkP superfamily phosphohydrolase/phosphomutase
MDRRADGVRVLFVGLDACDATTMLGLAAAGRCPNLAGLLATSAVAGTAAPYGTFVGSSWMTISTGTNVGTHAYWNWIEVDPATYGLVGTTPRSVQARPFWELLSDAGQRVAVFDIPHLGVPPRFNGVVVKEWGCHDRHDGTASFPPSALVELDREIGRHPVGCRDHPRGDEAFAPCDYASRAGRHPGGRRTVDEQRHLLELLRAGVEAKRLASLRLLADGPWDLFATVLGEGHCVGHQMWHLHDAAHPWHDPALRRELGDPVEDIYERLDGVLGDLLARVGPETAVLLEMNHGTGPHFDGSHLFEPVLARLDDSLSGRSRGRRWWNAIAAQYTRVGGEAGRAALRRSRRFFPILGNTAVGAVRFNVVGRESHGLVTPGAEFEALRDALTQELLTIVDLDSGRPFVTSVVRADDVLTRFAGDRFPDLFVEWERTSLPERLSSPTIGEIRSPYRHWRSGDHHRGGVFTVRAPGVTPGRRSEPMDLVDSAPTIAALLGVELPGVDGRPRLDLLKTTPA